MNRLSVAFATILGVLGFWAPPQAAQSLLRPSIVRDQGGAVTVEARYLDPTDSAASLQFEIKLDTHSASLDQHDLAQLAILRNDQGVVVKPTSFEKKGSGHHLQNILIFPVKDAAGELVIGEGAKTVELVLRHIDGVPQRTPRWEVQ
jgi:hypothetical protein